MSDTQSENIAYAICSMSDIPSQRAAGFNLMLVEQDGTKRPWPIVVVRCGRQVFGYVNKCPHDGVKLDWERLGVLRERFGNWPRRCSALRVHEEMRAEVEFLISSPSLRLSPRSFLAGRERNEVCS